MHDYLINYDWYEVSNISNLYFIHNKNTPLTIKLNQPEEVIQYSRKTYH